MHVSQLDAFHVRVPLRRTVRHASHTRDENDTLLVRCRLADGTTGWGEGLPRPYVTGETIQTALRLFRDGQLARQLDGVVTGLPSVIAMLDEFELPRPERGLRDCFGNTVRCAVELSILDAVCRSDGVPLSEVTALLPESQPIRQQVDRVRYSGAIPALRPKQLLMLAVAHRLYQFRHCKVKVGVPGQDDGRVLRTLRHILGRRMDLRVDANEAWMAGEVAAKLQPLLPVGISAVEQPVPHDQIAALADLRRQVSVPLVLDESLCTLSDARRAVEEGLCDILNIRLSKCGGLLNSLRLAAFAHQSGIGYQLGCQVGETGVLSAAGRHFATSVAGLRYVEGSFDRHLLAVQFTRPDMTFRHGGWAPALTGPGLGIDVDGDWVAARATAAIPVRVGPGR